MACKPKKRATNKAGAKAVKGRRVGGKAARARTKQQPKGRKNY